MNWITKTDRLGTCLHCKEEITGKDNFVYDHGDIYHLECWNLLMKEKEDNEE